MMAKIEWYQEVLEQEPGSRVFFPLARLLEQVGQSEEALVVLRNGVAQNPDFLEARLLLIQLLHEQGHAPDCGAEVANVANLFEVYPAFWDAWAASAAAVNRDLELALRFMAATFHRPDISLCDVLVSGLGKLANRSEDPVPVLGMSASVLVETIFSGEAVASEQSEAAVSEQNDVVVCDEETPLHEGDSSAQEAPPLPPEDACTADSEHADAHLSCLPRFSEEPDLCAQDSQDDCTEASPEQPCAAQEPNEELLSEQPLQDDSCCDDRVPAASTCAPDFASDFASAFASDFASACASACAADLVSEDSPASSDNGDNGDSATDAVDPADDTVFLLKDIITDDVCTTAAPDETPSAEDVVSADDVNEPEPTLRTRSMANVLAEQGDFAGALEIYQELEASAPSPEEAQILHEYVAALGAHLTGTSVPGDSVPGETGDGMTTPTRTGNATGASGKSPSFPKTTATASEAADVPPPSQRKLMFLLESLADRLEARARA